MSKNIRIKLSAILLTLVLAFGLTAVLAVRAEDEPADTVTAVNGWTNYRSQDIVLEAGEQDGETVLTAGKSAGTTDWVWYGADLDTTKVFEINFTLSQVPEGDAWMGVFLFPGDKPETKYGATHAPENAISLLVRANASGVMFNPGELYYNGINTNNLSAGSQAGSFTATVAFVFTESTVDVLLNRVWFARFSRSYGQAFFDAMNVSHKAQLAIRYSSLENAATLNQTVIHSVDNTKSEIEYKGMSQLVNGQVDEESDGTITLTQIARDPMPQNNALYVDGKVYDTDKAIDIVFDLKSIPGYHNDGVDCWIGMYVCAIPGDLGNFGSSNSAVLMLRASSTTSFGGEVGWGAGRHGTFPIWKESGNLMRVIIRESGVSMLMNGGTMSEFSSLTAADFGGKAYVSMVLYSNASADSPMWSVNYRVENSEPVALTIEESDLNYDRAENQDVVFRYSGCEDVASVNGEGITAESYDMDLQAKTVTIKKAFLFGKPNGTLSFNLVGTNGTVAPVTVTTEGESSVSLESSYLEFDMDHQADITTGLQLSGGLSLEEILLNGSKVSADNYTYSAGRLTFKRSYLAGLGYGDYPFTLALSDGADVSLTVSVLSKIEFEQAPVIVNRAQAETVEALVIELANGGFRSVEELSSEFYSYDPTEKTLTVTQAGLLTLSAGEHTLTVCGYGRDNQKEISVSVSGDVAWQGWRNASAAFDGTYVTVTNYTNYVGEVDLKGGFELTFRAENLAPHNGGAADQWVGIFIHTQRGGGFQSGNGLSVLVRNEGDNAKYETYVNGLGNVASPVTSSLSIEHTLQFVCVEGSWLLIADGSVQTFTAQQIFGENPDAALYVDIDFNNGQNALAGGGRMLLKPIAAKCVDGAVENGLTAETNQDGTVTLTMSSKRQMDETADYIPLEELDKTREIVFQFTWNQIPDYHSNNSADVWFGVILSGKAGETSFADKNNLVALIRPQSPGRMYGYFGSGTAMPGNDDQKVVEIQQINQLKFVLLKTRTDIYLNNVKMAEVRSIDVSSYEKLYAALRLHDAAKPMEADISELWQVTYSLDNAKAVEYPQIAVEQTELTFDKGTPADLEIVLNGTDEFVSITGNSILPENYTHSGNTITLLSAWLQTIANGEYNFTLTGADGSTVEVTVTVCGEPAVAQIIVAEPVREFDKGVKEPEDLVFEVSGDTFVSLTGHGVSESDYSFADDRLTIFKSYLLSVQTGEYRFTVTGASGKTALITVTVKGEIYVQIAVENASFTFDRANPSDITLKITAGVFSNLSAQGLMPGDYSVAGATVVISQEFFSSCENGTIVLTLFGIGVNNSVQIQVTITGETKPVNPPKAGCSCGGKSSAMVAVLGAAMLIFAAAKKKFL